jgi:hypothetical protein
VSITTNPRTFFLALLELGFFPLSSPSFTSWLIVQLFCGTKLHLSRKIAFQISNQVIYCQEINYMIKCGAPHRFPYEMAVLP